jgi:amino acid transporter
MLATLLILFSIALINHFGVRLASRINDLSVGAEVLGTFVVGLILLVLAFAHRTNPPHFLFTHPEQSGGFSYLAAFGFSSLMSAWTLTGFEGAANLAEETQLPERQVPVAIVGSVVTSVLLGFLVLIGFTLAIPNLQVATHHPTPLLYILGSHFPPIVSDGVMIVVFISIYACALANLAALTRMVWAMARDKQLPSSVWLGRVSARKVPANAVWFVTVLAAVFTLWARLEVVMTGIAALAGYVTYAIVVSATLKRRVVREQLFEAGESIAPGERPGEITVSVSRPLCVAALVWILLLICFLSLPRSARQNSMATLVAVAVGAIIFFVIKQNRSRTA